MGTAHPVANEIARVEVAVACDDAPAELRGGRRHHRSVRCHGVAVDICEPLAHARRVPPDVRAVRHGLEEREGLLELLSPVVKPFGRNGVDSGQLLAKLRRELLRVVVYVCMTPGRAMSAEARARRRLAFATRTGTTHWPDHFVDAQFMDESIGADKIALALGAVSNACRELVG